MCELLKVKSSATSHLISCDQPMETRVVLHKDGLFLVIGRQSKTSRNKPTARLQSAKSCFLREKLFDETITTWSMIDLADIDVKIYLYLKFFFFLQFLSFNSEKLLAAVWQLPCIISCLRTYFGINMKFD